MTNGYVVSMIPTYRFIVEKNKRDEDYRKELDKEKNSKYIGEVHNSVEVKFVGCKMISSWDNMYGGTTRRYKFVTEEGNVIMWDTSKYIDLEERRIHDKTFNGTVVGTVKKLEEYNGVKQTWLTRCKVAFDD